MRIGFIGLGMMGHHMAANLQEAGHDLVVYDVRREAGEEALSRGARWAETPADAARQSEIVMTSLPGPKEVELAHEFAVPMPLAAMAEQALIECLNRGWGGKDMTAAFALQEERAQVQVRV